MTATLKQADPNRKRKLMLRLARALLVARAMLGFTIALIFVIIYPPESFLLALLGLPALYVLHAVILLLVSWGLGRGSRALFWMGFAFMVLQLSMSLLTVRALMAEGGQVGALDVVDVVVSLGVLVLLVAVRRGFGVRW